MFSKLSNSWELVKASWGVLLADKELLLFPVVSFFASLIVLATFAIPTFLVGIFDNPNFPILGYVVGFLFYTCMYAVTIFANSAVVGAATIRLEGGDPTVSDGFRIAFKHIGSILGYAVISATVGMILRAISERSGAIGRILVSLVGFAWSVATFLVIPVLVIEGATPIDAIKRSGSLLKQTWGEQLVGNFGIGTVFALVYVLLVLATVPLLFIAIASESVALIIIFISLVMIAFMLVAMIQSTLSGIYTAAVYRYATTGEAGEFFDPETVKNTFKHR